MGERLGLILSAEHRCDPIDELLELPHGAGSDWLLQGGDFVILLSDSV